MDNAKCHNGIITVSVRKTQSSNYKKSLDAMITAHFGEQGMIIVKDTDEDGSMKWVIGTEDDITRMVDKSLGI